MKKHPHILLVTADEHLSKIICEFLNSSDYRVTAVLNGDSGWHKYNNESPDIIISDFYHNGINGLELAKMIRSKDSHIPIILMSGYKPDEAREETLRLGASAFFAIPLKLEELKNCITELFVLECSTDNCKESKANKFRSKESVMRKNGRIYIPAIVTVVMLLFPPFRWYNGQNIGYQFILSSHGSVNVALLAVQILSVYFIYGTIWFMRKK